MIIIKKILIEKLFIIKIFTIQKQHFGVTTGVEGLGGGGVFGIHERFLAMMIIIVNLVIGLWNVGLMSLDMN